MKILFVSDKEEESLWDYYKPEKTAGIDLVISCGDLDPDYLQFLATMTNKPVLYVRGNHDTKYDRKPPLGCVDIDDEVYNYQGLRILGLGGSIRYGNSSDMYTEEEMAKRIRKLTGTLNFTNGFDLLVTHAPAKGYGDMEDLPHHGFECFNTLLDKWHPVYMMYGHVHKEYGAFQRCYEHPSGAVLMNAYGSIVVEINEDQYPSFGKTGSAIYDWWMIHRKVQ